MSTGVCSLSSHTTSGYSIYIMYTGIPLRIPTAFVYVCNTSKEQKGFRTTFPNTMLVNV